MASVSVKPTNNNLRSDLERQLKEELRSESDEDIPITTITALRQKFGLAFDPRSAKDIAKDLRKCKRLAHD